MMTMMDDNNNSNNEHPAKINNDAACLIGIGKYEEAIVKLGLSLKKVKMIMSSASAAILEEEEEDSMKIHPNQPPTVSVSCDFVSSPHQEIQPTFRQASGFVVAAAPGKKLHSSGSGSASEERRTTSSSIFEACIVVRGLPPTYDCSSIKAEGLESIKGCAELVSYAVLYNLALAHHIMAIKEDSSSSQQQVRIMELLKKAMTLYEHAHHILMNHQQSSSQVLQESISLMHPMAIASNLGHAFDMLGDMKNARLCFEHLLSTILYAVDCGEAEDMVHDGCCDGDSDTLDGFWKNVMPLLSATSSAPAA